MPNLERLEVCRHPSARFYVHVQLISNLDFPEIFNDFSEYIASSHTAVSKQIIMQRKYYGSGNTLYHNIASTYLANLLTWIFLDWRVWSVLHPEGSSHPHSQSMKGKLAHTTTTTTTTSIRKMELIRQSRLYFTAFIMSRYLLLFRRFTLYRLYK